MEKNCCEKCKPQVAGGISSDVTLSQINSRKEVIWFALPRQRNTPSIPHVTVSREL